MNNTIFVKEGNEFVEKEIRNLSVIMTSGGSILGGRNWAQCTINTKDGEVLRIYNASCACPKSDIVFLTEDDIMKNRKWRGFSCSNVETLCKKRYEGKDLFFNGHFQGTEVSFRYFRWDGNTTKNTCEKYGMCRFDYDFSNDTFKCIGQYGSEINPCYGNGKYASEEECITDNKVKIKRIPKKEETKPEVAEKCFYTIASNLSIAYRVMSGDKVSEEKWFRKYDTNEGVDTGKELSEIIKEFKEIVSPNGDCKFYGIYDEY